MPHLTVQNMGGRLINVQPGQTVLQALQVAGIDWMHACGAKGRCTTCRMVVVEGLEQLPPLTTPEERYRAAGRLQPNERLTCQSHLAADATVRVPRATQLPHQQYPEAGAMPGA